VKFTLYAIGKQTFTIQEHGKLPHCQAMYIWYRKLADKGVKPWAGDSSFHSDSAQRIGTVKNHQGDPLFCGSLHNQAKSAYVGV